MTSANSGTSLYLDTLNIDWMSGVATPIYKALIYCCEESIADKNSD